MRRKHLPNVPLVTHTGKSVRFYDDLVRDRKVVINFMYTVCSNICTPMTRNLLEARQLLGDFGRDIHFYSISLTPLDDDPPALRKYMQSYGIGEGWTFLTGRPEDILQVQRGLALAGADDDATSRLEDHTGMARVGNEATVRWGHASATSPGRAIARMIRFELTE
jgi:protein SCO1/2